MKIAVVTGMIATYPVGGVFWDYIQYAFGLKNLGFDVYYLEDTGLPTYISKPDQYISEALSLFHGGMENKWHYRSEDGKSYGLSTNEIERVIAKSDIFLNVSGGCLLRKSYLSCKCKILIDTDPGLNHFVNYPKWDKNPGWQGTLGYRAHDYFFTYAENIKNNDCNLPDLGLAWIPTRPLVVIDYWSDIIKSFDVWTTVMSWNPYQHYKNSIQYKGRLYGAKEMEFKRIESIPLKTDVKFELAIAGKEYPREIWKNLGWSIIDAGNVSKTPHDYRSYIQSSRGEFSVAKNVYVDTRSGWFSCRSICYMAAGKPVVLQDTGFSKFIPTGKGVLAFSTFDEAIAAIENVENDYEGHCQAARQIAKEYFSAEVVLKDMLNKIGLE